MMERKKSLLKKIVFTLMIIVAFILINGSDARAFTMGSLDVNGGEGISSGPQPYLFGDYYCIDYSRPLTRTEDGTKNSNRIVYQNRNNGNYYNEEIQYDTYATVNVEQSIAAGYLAFILGAGSNAQFQNVVWASGQWQGKPGYVNNLYNYTGTTVSATNALYDRAEGWANFYYNLLQPSGMRLNIDVLPTSEDDLRIYVDQNARTYTEGPYMINILDSSGNIINNTATEYHSAGTIGNLLYQELSGLNLGSGVFQFARLNSATATLSYTDGSTSEISNITILDANGNVLAFPKPGEVFYIRVEIPSGESRTVSRIEPHFNVQYLTQIPGSVIQYRATTLRYEITNDKIRKWAEATLVHDDGNTSDWFFNKTIAEIGADAFSRESLVVGYLYSIIFNNARADGFDLSGAHDGSEGNIRSNTEAWTMLALPGATEATEYRDLSDFRTDVYNFYWNQQRNSITVTTETTYEYKDYENGGSYFTNEYQGMDGLLGTTTTYTWHYNGGSYSSQGQAETAAANRAGELTTQYYNNAINNGHWYFCFNGHNPIFFENVNGKDVVQRIIEVSLPGSPGSTPGTAATEQIFTWSSSSITSFDLIGTDCTVEIGGKVWVDVGATKESSLNGRLNNGGADTGDYRYAGMEVQLYLVRDRNNSVGYAITDSNGSYHFDNLNALEDYIVVFKFNGQLYQQTYYKDDLSGGFSNAQEVDRSGFNDRFDRIDSYPSNYNLDNSWRIAYGKEVRLKRDDGTYISNGTDDEGKDKALTYLDAWNQFVSYASSTGSYENAYNSLRSWLQGQGVGSTDTNGVIQFIRDCMIDANTRQYPVYDQFVIENIDDPGSQPATETAVGQTWNSLYITSSDQSRNVDFGINERDTADLIIQKDVYKATVRVNGKTQTYMYNQKDADIDEDGTWNIEVRAADYLYNGGYTYNREIRKSEYLYDGTIYDATGELNNVGATNAKDLRVYVTYRIAIRNQSQTYDAVVNEVVDYFDTSEYVFDGELNGNTYTPNEYSDFEHSTVTSYIGDRAGNYIAPLTVKTESSLGNGRGNTDIGHGYTTEGDTISPLYLSGIVMPDTNSETGYNTEVTKGGGMAFIYLTFEVKKTTDENGMPNRVQMDVNVANGETKPGKQNIAEINGYSTYYGNDETIPGTLNSDNTVNNVSVDGQKGGVLDVDSTVGNLSSQDLDENGNLIITDNDISNRTEDDTDKAPNIRLVFPTDNTDENERTATGYVYEDNRTESSAKAMVGNGRYSESDEDVKVNGVTVQLVELVQDVDENGIPKQDDNGNYQYLGEYVWNAKVWDGDSWVDTNSSSTSGSIRYYSGQGVAENNINGNSDESTTVSPIISGPGITAIDGAVLTEEGQYAFKGMPAGDFIIRFIYGDTTQTVLTTTSGDGAEVTDLLSGETPDNQEGYITTSGLNAKSYNGQDYKSTTYQAGIDQNKTVVGSYNDIYGFGYGNESDELQTGKYDTQNYYITRGTQTGVGVVNGADGKDKTVNYYYNIGVSQTDNTVGLSDAKDVNPFREDGNNYSKGITGIDGEEEQTIVNGRSEVLTAGLKVASTEYLGDGETTSVAKQIAMLKELMNNTVMVAQTGVINTEVEWNTAHTDGQGDSNSQTYVLDDIDLGLQERPIAQLVMNKEVSNVRITLQDGTILFDTNRPVTNMTFADHTGHIITYNPEEPGKEDAYRLISVAIANNTASTPELITTYMDEELMYGARIEVDYTFTVTNVGEVDYMDNQFYYTGVTSNDSSDNIATTKAHTVVDYISNNIQFIPTSDANQGWSIRTVTDLTSNPDEENTNYTSGSDGDNNVGDNIDLINNKYYSTLNTYNNIVTTKDLSKGLYPDKYVLEDQTEEVSSYTQKTFRLSTTLTPDSGEETMVYNNLCEILQVSNSVGRRLKYSVTGNQPMADQEAGDDTPVDEEDEIYTKVDLVTPKEIDSDSSQEILILPPTGANRNYTLWIVIGVIALGIVAGGIFLIRRYFKNK